MAARSCRKSVAVVCLTVLLGGLDVRSASATEVERLAIEQPETHWIDSYIPLVPSIHTPTTHDRGDLIQAWLKLPPHGRIDVRWLEDQHRYTLVYPDGTQADRVEYFRVDGAVTDLADHAPFAAGTDRSATSHWTVADVRGTRLVDGRQWFHVYRPADGEPHATLTGWSWPRDDAGAHRRATDLLVRYASSHAGALQDEPMDRSAVEALRRLNDCASCHVPNRPRVRLAGDHRAVERATDSLGFIVPNAVLQDDCAIADHRPEDLNVDDRFVTEYCPDQRGAKARRADGTERLVCDDGSQPRGSRDVEAGLAAGHPYTQAVCASRLALYRRMTPAAQAAWSRAFAVCGIGPRAGE